jgi:hypothetical protein
MELSSSYDPPVGITPNFGAQIAQAVTPRTFIESELFQSTCALIELGNTAGADPDFGKRREVMAARHRVISAAFAWREMMLQPLDSSDGR